MTTSATSRYIHQRADRLLGREARVQSVIVYLLLFTGIDLALTLAYASTGRFVEANPLANLVLGYGGLLGVLAYKLVLTLPALLVINRLRSYASAEVGVWIIAAASTVVIGMWVEHVRLTPLLSLDLDSHVK